MGNIVLKIWLKIVKEVKRNSRKQQLKQRTLIESQDVNIASITHNWDKGKQLYDLLKRECHPDKFSGEKVKVATSLFQSILNNQYNYNELLSIKEEAIKRLDLNI